MNPFQKIHQFARELIGKPISEESIRQAAHRAFGKQYSGKRRSKGADPFGIVWEGMRKNKTSPALKANATPHPSVPNVETKKPPTDTVSTDLPKPPRLPKPTELPEPPEPVQIPEKMWVAGALGALLAPRAAGAMLSAPVAWKQREDARQQLNWQKQVDMLFKQLDYLLKAHQLNIASENATTDRLRALFYGQYVGQLGQRLPYQNAKDWAAALEDIAHAFHQVTKIPMETLQQYAELVLKAGDPRVDIPERIKLLAAADQFFRSHGFLLNPQGLKQMFPFLNLPEIPIVTPIPGATPPPTGAPTTTGTPPATGGTSPSLGAPSAEGKPEGGQVDVIDLGSPKNPAPTGGGQPQVTSPYSPAQRRALAEEEYLKSQVEVNREREEYLRQMANYYKVRTELLPQEVKAELERARAAMIAALASQKNADTNERELGLEALKESFNAINHRITQYQREIDNIDAFIRELGKQVPQVETRQVGPNGEVIIARQPDWSRAPRDVLEARDRSLRYRQQLQDSISKLQNQAAQLQQKMAEFR